jgi:hypothetical protein
MSEREKLTRACADLIGPEFRAVVAVGLTVDGRMVRAEAGMTERPVAAPALVMPPPIEDEESTEGE